MVENSNAKAKAGKFLERVEQFEQGLIVDEAVGLFYQHGYHRTSMDMIAAEIGVTKAYLYNRYKCKADILADIYARAEVVALRLMTDELESDHPPAVKLYRAVWKYARRALKEYQLIAVYHGEVRNLASERMPRVKAIRQQWEDALAKILEQGKLQGQFAYRDVHVAVLMIMGMVAFSHEWAEQISPDAVDLVCDDFARAALSQVGCAVPDVVPPSAAEIL